MRILSLALLLSVLWAVMSGHFANPIVVGMGVLGVILVIWLSLRMGLVDREGLPMDVAPRLVPYSVWLLREIIASNIVVGRIVASREAPISASVVEVPDGQTSDIGRALFANSITLTPGTVTLDADGDSMRVHALTSIGAKDLASGAMRDRAHRVDGSSEDSNRSQSGGASR